MIHVSSKRRLYLSICGCYFIHCNVMFLWWLFSTANGQRLRDDMYESLYGAAACYRRMNGTHQTGCSCKYCKFSSLVQITVGLDSRQRKQPHINQINHSVVCFTPTINIPRKKITQFSCLDSYKWFGNYQVLFSHLKVLFIEDNRFIRKKGDVWWDDEIKTLFSQKKKVWLWWQEV